MDQEQYKLYLNRREFVCQRDPLTPTVNVDLFIV